MSITATELKQNLGRYLRIAATEDVFITKNVAFLFRLFHWILEGNTADRSSSKVASGE